MPTFAFICKCGNAYEEFRWPSEGMPEACPACAEPFGENFNQNWMENRPGGLCKGESSITTFGQQAELNAKRMGKEQLQLMAEKERTRYSGIRGKLPEGARIEPVDTTPEIPWWRDGSIPGTKKLEKPLNPDTVKDTTEYIMTGRTQ